MRFAITRLTMVANDTILLLNPHDLWPSDLTDLLGSLGASIVRLADLTEVPAYLRRGPVRAVIMTPQAWSGRDSILLHECRALAPETALVVLAEHPCAPDLKRAFDHGATAFLRWPTSPIAVLCAIGPSPHLPDSRSRDKEKPRL